MIIWYAVIYNEDGDWDFGSHDFETAVSMANDEKADRIAIIDEGDNFCIGEYVRGRDF